MNDRKNVKLIVLQGPPFGKRTEYANELINKNGDRIFMLGRVGKCDIDHVHDVPNITEQSNVIDAINAGKDVIIDMINLDPIVVNYWENTANQLGCTFEVIPIYTPYNDVLKKNREYREERNLYIARGELIKFYKEYYPSELSTEMTDARKIKQPDYSLPSCVICDLDVTLAIHQGREPVDFELIPTDRVDVRLRDMLNTFTSIGIKVIFLTGRPEKYRKLTSEWLSNPKNNIMKGMTDGWELIMREDGDWSKGPVSKKTLYNKYIRGKYNVVCVFDDSTPCVEMWRELGLLTCQVANTDE